MANRNFFKSPQMNTHLNVLRSVIQNKSKEADETSNNLQLYGHIEHIIKDITNDPQSWDEHCTYSIEIHGENLTKKLKNITTNTTIDINESHAIFSYFLIFLKEFDLSRGLESSAEILDFAYENIESFDDFSKNRINFTQRDMPTALFKFILRSSEIKDLREISKTTSEAKTFTHDWDVRFKLREDSAKRLEDSLKKIKDGFNFVGLNQGFSELHNKKVSEKQSHVIIMFLMATLIVIPLMYKIYSLTTYQTSNVGFYYIFSATNTGPNVANSMLLLFSMVSYIAVMLYFFRVALFNYKSVCAQILQIELRMTLCRFIQHYSEHAAEIKKNSEVTLDKFENVIFSGIVNNDNNLPTTFDGIEQLASIFKTIKG
ncbi:hypothetical protein [Aeromonas veronii]|uniref:hypothetical protein n=1 Tax=Aeromonas veronii TaxID=654 RepID=UPI001010CC60|nr:hypothetical protein [Aeromonas veronii]